MASINVKVLDMVGGEITKVAYKGAEYSKVEGKAHKGDLARVVKPWGTQKGGSYYLVINEDHMLYSEDLDDMIFIKGEKSIASNSLDAVEVFRKATEASAKPTKANPKFEVGDYARVVDGYHSRYGEIVKIVCIDYPIEDCPYDTELLNGEEGDYFKAEDLEAVTSEEVAKAQKAEKFAKIGRKPDEFREGDIVRVTGSCSGHPVGTIGEIEKAPGFISTNIRVLVNGKLKSHIGQMELITPVENRFDRM